MCKPNLIDGCVHDLFSKTTYDQGPCPKLYCGERADKWKRIFLEQKQAGKVSARELGMMEDEAEGQMIRFVRNEVDRRIERAMTRTEAAQSALEVLDVEAVPEIAAISKQIDEKEAEAERAGEEGEVDKSRALLDEVAHLRREKASAVSANLAQQRAAVASGPLARANPRSNEPFLRVCKACGSLLSIKDADDRLAEHFEGKAHTNVVKVKTKLEQMRESRRLGHGGGAWNQQRQGFGGGAGGGSMRASLIGGTDERRGGGGGGYRGRPVHEDDRARMGPGPSSGAGSSSSSGAPAPAHGATAIGAPPGVVPPAVPPAPPAAPPAPGPPPAVPGPPPS